MHKEKKDKIQNYYTILLTIALLGGAAWAVYEHFAKTSVVEAGFETAAKTFKLVQQQFRIGAKEDEVTRVAGDVERAKNRLRFEKKIGNPTKEEEEDVAIQEVKLKAVEKRRDELIKQYESKE